MWVAQLYSDVAVVASWYDYMLFLLSNALLKPTRVICLPTLPIHNVPPLATEYMGTTRGTVHTARMTPSTCRYCHHCL